MKLYLEDAMDVLRKLPAVSADAVVTDPPYGVRQDDWDAMDVHEFARFTMGWMSEAARIAPAALVFCPNDSAIEQCAKMLYPEVRKLIWHKPLGSPYAGAQAHGVWFSYECVLHCHRPQSIAKSFEVAAALRKARETQGLSRGAVDMVIRGKKTGLCYRWEEAACLPTQEQLDRLTPLLNLTDDFVQLWDEAQGRKQTTKAKQADVLLHSPASNGRHPTEKPEQLMIDLLCGVGSEYQKVIDPFMGTGTTGVACGRLGRSFVGIESNQRYFDIASRRLKDEFEGLTDFVIAATI